MKGLGFRLKKAREQKNLNQIEVAKKLGISNGTLSGYERDYRDPDTETLFKLADIYDVSVDYLLGRTNNPNPNQFDNEPNLAFIDGGENLSEDEIEYLKESLEIYRKRKERFLKEKVRDNQNK